MGPEFGTIEASPVFGGSSQSERILHGNWSEIFLNADSRAICCKGDNLSQFVKFANTKKCKIVWTHQNVLSSRFVRLSKFGIIKPQHCDKQTVLSSAKITEALPCRLRHLALIISFHRAWTFRRRNLFSKLQCNACAEWKYKIDENRRKICRTGSTIVYRGGLTM